MKYIIVIPAKNEASGIGNTLQSIVNQTILPTCCIVVDDGSDDHTPHIVEKYAQQYNFIKCIYKEVDKNKSYQLGGHVVDVFYFGKQAADNDKIDYDVIIKLDADVVFEEQFIESLFQQLQSVDQWGIASGTPYYLEDGRKIFEYSPLWHSHGQFKVYKKKCLEDIGGLKRSLGWDTADNIVAMSKGWETVAFRNIFYRMNRKIGGKSSLSKGRINHGIGCYILGYNLGYFLLKLIHDIFKRPYIIGAYNLLKGFCRARINKYSKILSDEEIQILRKMLWKSFFQRSSDLDFILLQKFKTKKETAN